MTRLLIRYRCWIAIVIGILILLKPLQFIYKWIIASEKSAFTDSMDVEIYVGLIFAIVPAALGYIVGRRVKEEIFYQNVTEFLKTVKSIRPKIGAEATQQLMIDFSKTVGDGLLEKSWYKKLEHRIWGAPLSGADCTICGKEKEISEEERCRHCHLHCRAWETIGQMK